MRVHWPISAALLLAAGCSEIDTVEPLQPSPNEDVYLGPGVVAVDGDLAFMVANVQDVKSGRHKALLHAIRLGTPDDAKAIWDLSNQEDPRILFPQGNVLVMSEVEGSEHLVRFDRDLLSEGALVEPEDEVDLVGKLYDSVSANSAGTSVIAYGKETEPVDANAIDLIKLTKLDPYPFPEDGAWRQAAWVRAGDAGASGMGAGGAGGTGGDDLQGANDLLGIRYATSDYCSADPPGPCVDVDLWPASTLDPANWTIGSPSWNTDHCHFWISNIKPPLATDLDAGGSSIKYPWPSVSADHRWIAFPAIETEVVSAGETDVLILLDAAAMSACPPEPVPTIFDDIKGPVKFTPDSTKLVSYRDVAPKAPRGLVVIDLVGPDAANPTPMRHDFTLADTKIFDQVQFFVGDGIVILASAKASTPLELYDIRNPADIKIVKVDGNVPLSLGDVQPVGNSLWIAHAGGLYKLGWSDPADSGDLSAKLEAVTLKDSSGQNSVEVQKLNYSTVAQTLIMTDWINPTGSGTLPSPPRMYLYDPSNGYDASKGYGTPMTVELNEEPN